MLLSRVADSLYWAGRYLERADCTARIVWGFTEGIVDLPATVGVSWEPLLAITGTSEPFAARYNSDKREKAIVSFLLCDDQPGSVTMCVEQARENLRACRDVIPQFAWNVLNDLHLYLDAHQLEGVARHSRARFIERVRRDVERIDGIVGTTMIRDAAYHFWCLGELVERADMTTRVLGVQAAALLGARVDEVAEAHSEVKWMTVLRSVSGRQMYQRATRQPINGPAVVDFLLHHDSFPRSVRFCVDCIDGHITNLPRHQEVQPFVRAVTAELDAPVADPEDGAALDAAMDRIQSTLESLSNSIAATYGAA